MCYELWVPGVMAPPQRYQSPPLMLAAGAPHHAPRSLMSSDAASFTNFDLELELKRLLWSAVAVLALVMYFVHVTR
jgi:hypothetical protein